jgi:hypothetical protein
MAKSPGIASVVGRDTWWLASEFYFSEISWKEKGVYFLCQSNFLFLSDSCCSEKSKQGLTELDQLTVQLQIRCMDNDHSFGTAILTAAIQVMRDPEK